MGVLTRRRLLAGIGSTSLLGLAGCTWLFGTRTDLSGVDVANPYYGRVRVDVRIEQAGETVVDETLSVEQEAGSETVTCTWERDAEEPTIEARLADEEADWERLDLAERDEETAHVTVIVGPERGVTAFGVHGAEQDNFVDVCADEQSS